MQQTVGEGKVISKREYPALKSPPVRTRLDKSRELASSCDTANRCSNGFSRADCTRSTDQGGNLYFQADVGVVLELTTAQAAVRQIARLPMSRQQQRMIVGSNEQNKQFCFKE